MRDSTHKHRIGVVELMYFFMAVILLLLLGALAKGQTTPAIKAQSQVQPQSTRNIAGYVSA